MLDTFPQLKVRSGKILCAISGAACPGSAHHSRAAPEDGGFLQDREPARYGSLLMPFLPPDAKSDPKYLLKTSS